MAHVSRLRKNFNFAPVQLIDHSKVMQCGEKLNLLANKYTQFVFGVSCTIFMENMPGRILRILDEEESNG